MKTPQISGVAETCLYSSDLPRSVVFYRDVLGLRLMESGERMCVFSIADKQVLLLFQLGSTLESVVTPGGVIPPHSGSGEGHVAFYISETELDEWEKRLTEHGVSIESKVSWPTGARSIYFRDPDRNALELETPGVWGI